MMMVMCESVEHRSSPYEEVIQKLVSLLDSVKESF